MENAIYTCSAEQYETAYLALQKIIQETDLDQFLIHHSPEYFLSKDKNFLLEVLVTDSVKQLFGKENNIPTELLNVLLSAEPGFFAAGYGPQEWASFFGDIEKKSEHKNYEIYLDGIYSLLMKTPSNIPLCTIGFDVTEDYLLVKQIQGINNIITHKPDRYLNKFVRRKLLVQLVTLVAQKLGKKHIYYQKAKDSRRPLVRLNQKGYDDVFQEMGFSDDGTYFVQTI